MNFQNQLVALTESDHAVARVLADTFTRAGATVEWFSSSTTPRDFAQAHPKIDALVLCVPSFPVRATIELPDSEWAQALNGMLVPLIQLIQAIGAQMVARQHGCILILGGLAGSTGIPGWALASAVEGALLALTRSLACEWAPAYVRILYLAYSTPEGSGVSLETWAARTPLGRIAEPDEIARVALYLVSERASFTTGTLVHADGGWSAWGLLK